VSADSRKRRRRRLLGAFAAAAGIAALALFLRPAAGTRGAVAPTAAAPARPRPASAPAAPAAIRSSGSRPQPPVDGLSPDALARSAADDYRRRARHPRSSQPLDDDGPDPLERDREVTPITERGPNGEDPALTVYPLATGFEDPEPAVLYAHLSVGGRRIPARAVHGTVVTDELEPVGEIEYRDDGSGGDATPNDRVYTALFQPSAEAVPALSRSFLVQVVATTRGDAQRRAATSFLYSRPHAQLTGNYRDALANGSLEIGVEVEVATAGRFHLEATLYDADGSRKIAWAQAASALEPGRHWMTVPIHGLILRDRGVAGPYLVRWVALSTTTQMPNAKNRLREARYLTAPYDLASFSDQPFDDPGLLDAAERLERDLAEGPDRGR